MNWSLLIFAAATIAAAAIGWLAVVRVLADVRAGAGGRGGVAQQRRQPDQVQTQPRLPSTAGLTPGEILILNKLAAAWNEWCLLPDRGDDDSCDMCTAINRAQDLIALRVARRVNPGVWRIPSRRMGKSAAAVHDGDVQLQIGSNPPPPGNKPPMPPSPPPFTPAPPAPGAAAAPARADTPPHLTTRELWLMTQAYLAGKEPSSPRSVGEWLVENTNIPVRDHNGPFQAAPLSVGLATRAARAFGLPGQTPEAS